ncbi:MAG: response regulator transcription factor [Thermincola sp.]|nr:response regulator transcription factor [Thermincola sp.]MDT3703083.1 response regulator transcription factor [Thermincola sp.]
MNKGKIRVLLVDDHELLMLGLKTLLERKANIEVVATVKSGEEAIEAAQKTDLDIILMDIRMPGLSGIEACREIKENKPGTKVIMLTSYADEEAILASLVAGAEGYVLKQIGSDALVDAVEKVSQGQALLDPVVTKKVIEMVKNIEIEKNQGQPEILSALTEQEKKVLGLMTQGKTNKEIADKLFLSDKTVRNYVSGILHKMDFQNRTQAIAFGLKNKLDRVD